MDDRNTQQKGNAYDETLADALRYGMKTEELIMRYKKQIEDTKGLDMVKDILISILPTVGEINSSIKALVGREKSSDHMKTEPDDKMTSLNAILESTMCIEKMLDAYKTRWYNDSSSQETIKKIIPIFGKIARVKTDTEEALRFLDDNPKTILALNLPAGIHADQLLTRNTLSNNDFFNMLGTVAQGDYEAAEFHQPKNRKERRNLYKKHYKT